MALFALLALVIGLPLYTFQNVGAETTAEAVPAPAAPLPKGAASNGRASISLRSLQPLTIAGRGFKSRERVRITGAGSRTVVATRGGGFLLRMGYRDPCASLSITAVGSKGSRASLNFSQLYCAAP